MCGIVAEHGRQVVGWGSLSPYHRRSAYRNTVENSVYVHPDWQGRGIGSLILQDLIKRAQKLGHHAIIAVIDADQADSVHLHTKFKFQRAGHLQQIRSSVHVRGIDQILGECDETGRAA